MTPHVPLPDGAQAFRPGRARFAQRLAAHRRLRAQHPSRLLSSASPLPGALGAVRFPALSRRVAAVMAETVWNPDTGEAVYRSRDPVLNLRLR